MEPFSFSHSFNNNSSYGMGSDEATFSIFSKAAPEAVNIGGDPWKWTLAQVYQWLVDCDLEAAALKFKEEDIDGPALSMVTADDVTKLFPDASAGLRLRVYRALSHLRNYGDEFSRRDQSRISSMYNQQSIHLNFNASSLVMALMPYILNTELFLPRITLLCYYRRATHGGGGGWGRGNATDRTLPSSLPQGTPFYMMQLYRVSLDSYSESGSGGGSTPNTSISFRYKTRMLIHYLGVTDLKFHTHDQLRQFMGLSLDDAPNLALELDPFLLSPGITIDFNAETNICQYFEWGKHMQWSPKTHTLFPVEFRLAASTFVHVWRTPRNVLGEPLAPDLGYHIVKILARQYSNASPFDDYPHPEPERLEEEEENDDADNQGGNQGFGFN